MRWSLFLIAIATSTASARPSNPAFLGISMGDIGGVPAGGTTPLGPCQVGAVTRGSGAMAAGLQAEDLLVTIDGAKTSNCDAVLKAVQGHDANDSVSIEVLRGGMPLTLSAQLLSRDEILRRRLVGQPIDATDFISVDDPAATLDLSSPRGKTLIVAWFSSSSCSGCGAVLGRLATWARSHSNKRGTPIAAVAVIPGEHFPKTYRGGSLEVPLYIADPLRFDELTLRDNERITFMVVDCRGVVQHIAPVLPDGEDADAMLDGLYAAAEQVARRATK